MKANKVNRFTYTPKTNLISSPYLPAHSCNSFVYLQVLTIYLSLHLLLFISAVSLTLSYSYSINDPSYLKLSLLLTALFFLLLLFTQQSEHSRVADHYPQSQNLNQRHCTHFCTPPPH